MRKLITEDGYRFTEQSNGTWISDGGDMTIENLQEFTDSIGVTFYEDGAEQSYKLLVGLPDKTLAEVFITADSKDAALEAAKNRGYDVLTIKLMGGV
jgi:hypothetical protein